MHDLQMREGLGQPSEQRCSPQWKDILIADLSLLLGGVGFSNSPHRERRHPDLVAVGAAVQFIKETDRPKEEAPESGPRVEYD